MIALSSVDSWIVVALVVGLAIVAIALFVGRFLSPTRFDYMPREWVESQRRQHHR